MHASRPVQTNPAVDAVQVAGLPDGPAGEGPAALGRASDGRRAGEVFVIRTGPAWTAPPCGVGPDRPDRSRGTGGAHRTAYRPVRAPVPTVRTTTTDCPSISPGVRTRLALACRARRRAGRSGSSPPTCLSGSSRPPNTSSGHGSLRKNRLWTTTTVVNLPEAVRENEEVVPVNAVSTWVLPSGVTVGR